MSTLYSSVHHEMIGPLTNNVEVSVRLIRKLVDPTLRELAQIILICSKSVLLHANDLLDQKFLQDGRFAPAYVYGSIKRAMLEILQITCLTLGNRDIKVTYDFEEIERMFPIAEFDKRRL